MKKIFILIFLVIFCVRLTACGEENSTPPLPSSGEPEIWGSITETAVPTEDVPNEFGALGVEVPVQDDETIAELKELIMALVMCDFADGMQFDPYNSTFFWRAMNYYTANVCYRYGALSEDMSWAVFSEDQVLYFAKRLFGGVEALPALLDTGMIERWESGEYAFMLGNYGDVLLELGEITTQGDGYTVEATLISGMEEKLGAWTVKMSQIDGEYCVTGILYG